MDILDYTDLVRRYETGLIENLRSFGFQAEYLELWVPDEDLSRSLLNLFDAAAEAGQHSLAVRISAEAATGLEAARFSQLAGKRGTFSVEKANGSAVLQIIDLHVATASKQASHVSASAPGPAAAKAASVAEAAVAEVLRQPTSISAPYASSLAAIDKTAPTANIAPGAVNARTEIDGLVFEAAIDPKDHTIRAMTSKGAKSVVLSDLLAVLARLCQGLPILEAADHGAIRLEYRLRGDAARPRAGVVIAETVDPAFRFVSALLRDILADYRRQTGFQDRTSTFDVTPGSRWMQADDAARRARLTEAVVRGGFPSGDVNVVAIEYDVRVVVSLKGSLANNSARTLTLLERCIKQHVDPRLELFLSEAKDSNKLRRLSEQQSKAS